MKEEREMNRDALSPPPRAEATVFLIDDEEDLIFLVEAVLVRSGFKVISFQSGASFGQFLKSTPFEEKAFVITDYRLPDCTGVDILTQIATENFLVGAAIQTGYSIDQVEIPKLNVPITVFEKPVEFEDLIAFARTCFNSNK